MRRSRAGKLTRMMASTCGTMIEAAAPWTRRAITRKSLVGATPDAADASVNSSIPPKKTRRRP
jgi:hypothetical protein